MADTWNPRKDPVAGYNPRLGVYTTRSGRSIDKFTYQKVTGKTPKAPVNNAPKNPLDTAANTRTAAAGGARPPAGMKGPVGVPDPRSPENVRKLQQFLKNRGYSITVDGAWGPETERAAKWFRQHHTTSASGADAYNAKFAATPTPKPPPGVTGPVGTVTKNGKTVAADTPTNPSPAPTSENGDGPGPSGNTVVPDAYSAMVDKLMGGIRSGVDSPGNVNKLAAAMTNSKFAPVINEMRRQVTQGRKDATAHQNTIGSWFKSLVNANGARNTADDKNLASLLHGSEGFMQKMAGTLGDPGAAQELAKTAGSNDALLRGLGANQSEFDKNMADALSLTGRDTMSATAKADDSANTNLKAQLLDLISQRGDALTQNRDSVRNNLLTRQSQRINNLATLSMLPGQMDQQTLDGLYKQAQISHLVNPPKKGAKPTGWAAMTAKDKRQLDSDIFSALHVDDGNGNMVLNPQYQKDPAAAVRLAANIARARGLKPRMNQGVNTAVKASLSNSLGSAFHNDWLPMINGG